MIDFFLYSLSMCFILFLIGTDLNILQLLLNVAVITFNVLNMLVFCMHGNVLTYEVSNKKYFILKINNFLVFLFKFAKLAKIIYFTDWYNWPEEHKQMIKLFILQTQKPVYIMIGPQFQMTLATFLSFWNRSYSAFTTLRGVSNNSNQ